MNLYRYDIHALTDGDYARYYALMAEEKRRRTDRFRFPDDKKRAVAGDMLARRAVAAWCGVPEESVVFDLSPDGKPFARGLDAEFSVSHSGSLAICAVDGEPVGTDVEQLRPMNLSVAKRVCTAAELCRLFGRPPVAADFTRTEDPALLERFFTLWTRKEAYGKYTGRGVFQEQFFCPETGFETFREGEYLISVYPLETAPGAPLRGLV